MSKQVAFLTQILRAAALSALVFLHSYWIPKLYIIPELDLVFGRYSTVVFHLFVSIIYIVLALLARLYPKLLARATTTQVATLITAIGSTIILLNGGTETAFVILLGGVFYISGSYWVNLFAHISLARSDKVPYLIGIALAFPLSRFSVAFISDWGFSVGMVLGIVIPFVVYFLSSRNGGIILSEYLTTPSPYDLSVTNPSSFLPITNKFFIILFLFNFVYASLPSSEVGSAQQPFPVLTLLAPILVVGYCILKKEGPPANFLFQAASLFIVAAALVSLAFPDSIGRVQYDLAACSICLIELMLNWYAIILLGSRNPLSILPTLVWGRAALSLGVLLGVVLTTFFASPQGYAVISAIAAFLFIGFSLIGLKEFDFDAMANRTTRPYVADHAEPALADFASRTDIDLEAILVDKFGLTPRETEVFELLARGRSYRYIESALVLSRNTVKSHIRRIYRKLDIHSQQELIDFCEELSLQTP